MNAPEVELKDVNQQAAMGSFFSAFQDSLSFGAPSSSSGHTDAASKGHTFYLSYFPAFFMFILDRYIASIDFLLALYSFMFLLVITKNRTLGYLGQRPSSWKVCTWSFWEIGWPDHGQDWRDSGVAGSVQDPGWETKGQALFSWRRIWKESDWVAIYAKQDGRFQDLWSCGFPGSQNPTCQRWQLSFGSCILSLFFRFCPFLVFAFNLLLIWIISIWIKAAWSARRSSVAWMPWAEYSYSHCAQRFDVTLQVGKLIETIYILQFVSYFLFLWVAKFCWCPLLQSRCIS